MLGFLPPESLMSKQRPTPKDSQPENRTQVIGQDQLRSALEASAETRPGLSATNLPPEPPLEESTQPLPLVQERLAAELEAVAQVIVEAPDATVAMKAGMPVQPPEDGSTRIFATENLAASTQALPTGTRSMATQVMPAELPLSPEAGSTQVLPEIRTLEIPPDRLPSSGKKRPLWLWAGLAALALVLIATGLYFIRPELLGLGASEASSPETIPEAPTPQTQTVEAPAPEIPPALRAYFEKAEKGDPAAMRMLGVMYYNGLNVPRNAPEGLKWYRKAANAGSMAAQKELRLLEEKAPPK